MIENNSEQMGTHSMESTGVVSKFVPPLIRVPLTTGNETCRHINPARCLTTYNLDPYSCFLALDSSQAAKKKDVYFLLYKVLIESRSQLVK